MPNYFYDELVLSTYHIAATHGTLENNIHFYEAVPIRSSGHWNMKLTYRSIDLHCVPSTYQ